MLSVSSNVELCLFWFSRSQWPSKKRTPDVYTVPNAGTGKRISYKPLPDTAAANRNGSRVMSYGATDQNLVPKSTNEVKKGDTSDQRIERTRKTSTSSKSCGASFGSWSSGPELVDYDFGVVVGGSA